MSKVEGERNLKLAELNRKEDAANIKKDADISRIQNEMAAKIKVCTSFLCVLTFHCISFYFHSNSADNFDV